MGFSLVKCDCFDGETSGHCISVGTGLPSHIWAVAANEFGHHRGLGHLAAGEYGLMAPVHDPLDPRHTDAWTAADQSMCVGLGVCPSGTRSGS